MSLRAHGAVSSARGRLELALRAAELLTVCAWAVYVTRPWLDLDPGVHPAGREFGQSILTHHFWTQAKDCGTCALWFGNTRGGMPALVNGLVGSMLHPLVAVTALGWGVLAGAKLSLVGAFIMAGMAQWWLGLELGVGRLARVWSAAMLVVGGHLASRMELGSFSLTISTAAATLVYPALLAVITRHTRGAAVALGAACAAAAVSGNGYVQVGLALTLPVAVVGTLGARREVLHRIRRLVQAGSLTCLLVAPMLVPYAHFAGEFFKESDPAFRLAQPFAYVPLNLVINDFAFFASDSLGKQPFPSHYMIFVGWFPVLIAFTGLVLLGYLRRLDRRVMVLALLVVAALWVASAAPLRWLATAPSPSIRQAAIGVRATGLISALAVPPLLGLAAIGVDRVKALLRVSRRSPGRRRAWELVTTRALLVLLLLAGWQAMQAAQQSARSWIRTVPRVSDIDAVIASLETADLQWVAVPLGEHFYLEEAVRAGLKLSDDFLTWRWRGRQFPEPVIHVARGGPPAGMTAAETLGGLVVARAPGREYAVVTTAQGERSVCQAHGTGAHLRIECSASFAGRLTVKEYAWTGWRASRNGEPAALVPAPWLTVDLPAGQQRVELDYLPWDVWLGVGLMFSGVLYAAGLLAGWDKTPVLSGRALAPVRWVLR